MTTSTQVGWHFPYLRKLVSSCFGSGKLLTTLLLSFISSFVFAQGSAPTASDVDQGANGALDAPHAVTFQNGNLHGGNSHFLEGHSIPYRLVMTNLVVDQVYVITIGFDALEKGWAAIDYITGYNNLTPHNFVPHNTPEAINPLNGLAYTDATFNNVITNAPLPAPSYSAPAATGSWLALEAAKKNITLYGGTVANAADVWYPTNTFNPANIGTGVTTPVYLSVRFTAKATTALLAWGGHIAKQTDYGDNTTAVTQINGAPYHMRRGGFTNSNGSTIYSNEGADRSVSIDAIIVCEVTPGVIAGTQSICTGQTLNAFTVTTAATFSGTPTYRWESATSCEGPWTPIADATGPTYTPPATLGTIYYHRVAISEGACEAASNCLSVTVSQTAPQPTVQVTPPTCTVATGTVCVTAPLDGGGIDYEYSSNGGTTWQDAVCFTVNAGAAYSIIARIKGTTCNSPAREGTMPAQPGTAPQPTVQVTPPTCTVATGTVCVTAPLDGGGIDYEYSSNGGTTWQDAVCFTVNAGAAYSIIARIKGTTCNSPAREGTMPAQPGTAPQPTVQVTPPTCTVATGTVCVTAPLDGGGIDYEYSSNGGTTWQDAVCFTVNAGAAYSIIARIKGTTCNSPAREGTMPAQPGTAPQPTVQVTPPTCTVATGTVCVTAPLDGGGIDYEYSSNGGTTWQDAVCFTVNAGAAYSIIARIKGTTCNSPAREGTMPAQPGTAPQPTVQVTPPTCTVATGTVCVTAPLDGGGIDYEYSSNGGTTWQDAVCFTVNAGAAYSIIARIKGTTCNSPAREGTMPAQPGTAPQPTVQVTPPTCTVATGTVCVTAPLDGGGIDYEYSSNGGTTWQDAVCFTVNAGAAYSIIARIKGTTCNSPAREGTMPAQPGTAPQPTVQVTPPTCTVATGTVCVTAPLDGGGIDYEYSSNGGTTWQDAVCFTVNAGAAYSIIARIKGTTCNSPAREGTMPAQPGTAPQPTVQVTPPTCTVATGTVCVTAPLDGGGIDYEYSSNGGTTWQDAVCFTVNAGAAYSIIARIKGTTCNSAPRTGTMAAAPACGDVYGSYTQGYYGGKGKSCNDDKSWDSPIALINDLLSGGSITVGRDGRSVVIPVGSGAIVNAVMPGGGTANWLTKDANVTISNTAGSLFQQNYLTKQGRINNVFLSQTIALSLNVRLNSSNPDVNSLGAFPIEYTAGADSWFQTFKTSGCDEYTATEECTNAKYVIPLSVTNFLTKAGTVDATVTELLALANDLLGGTKLPGANIGGYIVPSYADVSSAVDAINRGFDEWRQYVGSYGTELYCPELVTSTARLSTGGTFDQTASSIMMNVKAFPNPYTDRVQFNIESSVSGKGSLVVYNMLGQKVKTVFEGYVFAGRGQVVDFKVPAASRANLIYVLTIGGKQRTGKLLSQR